MRLIQYHLREVLKIDFWIILNQGSGLILRRSQVHYFLKVNLGCKTLEDLLLIKNCPPVSYLNNSYVYDYQYMHFMLCYIKPKTCTTRARIFWFYCIVRLLLFCHRFVFVLLFVNVINHFVFGNCFFLVWIVSIRPVTGFFSRHSARKLWDFLGIFIIIGFNRILFGRFPVSWEPIE